MPLQKLQFRPGLNREGTDYSNEGGWYDGDKIRFRSGFPEKIGGWIRVANDTFLGVCRALWNWVDTSNNNYIGLGTSKKYYIESGGSYNDVTPLLLNSSGSYTTTLGASPLSTTDGSPVVQVTDGVSGISPEVGGYVILTSTSLVGGLNINGEYVITRIVAPTVYEITATANASATASGGGTVTVQYEYPTGDVVYTLSSGWGAGPWSPTVTTILGTDPFYVPAGSNIATVTQVANNFLTTAGSFTVGKQYKIVSVGTTDFIAIGASANTVGVIFTATGVGSGTGTASIVWVAFRGAVDLVNTVDTYTIVGEVDISTTSNGISLYGVEQTPFSASLFNNTFEITYVDANTYTIELVATAPLAYIGGGNSVTVYPEYGIRPWGSGTDATVGQQLRLWTNDNFGDYLFIAPRGGPIYYWIPNKVYPDAVSGGLSTRAQNLALQSTAAGYDGDFVPNATFQVVASAIQRFIIAMGANSYVSTDSETDFDPLLVRWSDQENPYEWVPSATNQAGEFRLSSGSSIICARATRQEILIWTDSALYSMQYLGPPYVWGFNIMMDNISIMSPNAAITVNNVTYWMGNEKFYMYSGRVETLPCSLRQYIFEDLNQDQSYQVFAGANEGYNEVWWFYVSNNSTDSQVDRYVIYNYLDRVWYYGTMNRTAWLQSGLQQYPIAAFTAPSATFTGYISGTTLTVTNVLTGALSVNAEIIGSGIPANTAITAFGTGTGGAGTYTISTALTIAEENMSISGGSGVLLYHEAGVDDVSGLTPLPIDAYVQSSDFDIGDGHNFGFVWRILPDINFNGSSRNQPYVTMTVRPRQNSGTPYGTADNPQVQSYDNFSTRGVYNVQEFDGQVYTRLRGRQLAFRIESTELGVSWQLGTPRIDIRPDGRR